MLCCAVLCCSCFVFSFSCVTCYLPGVMLFSCIGMAAVSWLWRWRLCGYFVMCCAVLFMFHLFVVLHKLLMLCYVFTLFCLHFFMLLFDWSIVNGGGGSDDGFVGIVLCCAVLVFEFPCIGVFLFGCVPCFIVSWFSLNMSISFFCEIICNVFLFCICLSYWFVK